ncbi:glycerol acyltransferase [Thermoanaerobacterium thermosaccharolyticum]|uniref:Phospholipid/glycerol acyltransferase n=2 Tax=Thermoanaerobacterium thermosaccharolyticum TaxID=1517 RepID=D9TQ21_THETC|nr:lysophospholipid acyltransferase family protein [Thermoanaerobacterium thermosaccharolyticum]AGB19692.1 LOW QUALITY PROTEIN: 1-acyl-sn-glycerol-3-phosphate acyltransferase [Thermoanaerobacterium thermosaccharolyticum M0795]ADL69553.1 phospholipid/glycerol acyltransferase [Thermoanaerobacterium thermosaccharolyticum DSM 571]MBE0070037.1 1-acyl-sn-glycerol-3-phosphate acyltransferase [Thermoanaerobacterium thermosaccharolyticum]MBE0229571.1 1-acyl-sn-glycerol-3-phosphate acyltransferase [Therm
MKGFNFYNLARSTLRVLFRYVWKLQIIGIENIPANGPLIIVANHSSLLDGLVMVAAFNFRLTFFSAAYLFDVLGVGFVLKKIKAIPVSTYRKTVSSRRTVKDALDVLKNNGILMIFPEGGLYKTDEIVNIKSGASFFSVKAKVPVLPVAIIGTKNILPKGSIIPRTGKIIINVGCIINPADDIESMSCLVVNSLNKLMIGDVK